MSDGHNRNIEEKTIFKEKFSESCQNIRVLKYTNSQLKEVTFIKHDKCQASQCLTTTI